MRIPWLILGATGMVLLGAGCSVGNDIALEPVRVNGDIGEPPVVRADAPAEDEDRILSTDGIATVEEAVYLNQVAGSEITARGVITEEDGKMRIVITRDQNDESDVDLPASLRLGSCQNLGGELYSLNDLVDGQSDTILTSSLADVFTAANELSLVIGRSEGQSDIVAACGNVGTPAAVKETLE